MAQIFCFLLFLAIATCASSVHGQDLAFESPEDPEDSGTLVIPPRERLELTISELKNEIKSNGCAVNNFCFALQNTALSGKTFFELQKLFAVSAAEVLSASPRTELSAVQYGSISTTISMLMNNWKRFSSSVRIATFGADPKSSLRPPIVACDTLLYDMTTTKKVMVLLSDGTQNFGGDPVYASQIFQSRYGAVYGIEVGRNVTEAGSMIIKDIVGPFGAEVPTIRGLWQVHVALRKFVKAVC